MDLSDTTEYEAQLIITVRESRPTVVLAHEYMYSRTWYEYSTEFAKVIHVRSE